MKWNVQTSTILNLNKKFFFNIYVLFLANDDSFIYKEQ